MRRWIFPVVFLVTFAVAAAASWGALTRNPENLSLRELGRAAGEAYIYAYPLLVMDQTRASMLAAPETDERPNFTTNRLSHIRHVPRYGDEAVVRPNLDTLYSIAWLDLSQGPVVLRWPEMGGRYWLFQILDAWTDVAGAPGARTQGAGPGAVMISGPGWDGPPLPGMDHVRVDTNMAWIIGRIAVSQTEADLTAARALQDGFSLSGSRIEATPESPPAPGERPSKVIAELDADAALERLSRLLADNPPREADGDMQSRLSALGVTSGARSAEDIGWIAHRVIRHGVNVARKRLAAGVAERPYGPTGWRTLRSGVGEYGTDYAMRAGVALIGLGANLAEDAIYPTTDVDVSGYPLHGEHAYRIRFEPGGLPPADAFWSITAYDSEGFLMDTPWPLFSDRSGVVYDDDGGVTLFIGPPSLREAPANQLSVAPGPFQLTARLYLPRETALSGAWNMPPVERVER